MANLKSLWHKKIIRVWIVILMPLAILSGYGSYSLKEKSMLMEDKAKSYLFSPFEDETDSNSIKALSQNPEYPKEAKEFFHLRDKYSLESNICSIVAGVLLFFPALLWIRKQMGLEGDGDFVIHACRHTCASRLVNAGVDLYVVKEWLGHSTIKITERYAHLDPSKLVKAVNVLNE